MRNGVVIVDGVNLYETYGVFVSKGGYNDLIQWPALKDVEGNDWQEYDGFEPDLTNPVLDTRTLTIKFVMMGSITNIDNFYHFLGSQPTMTYNFVDLGRTMTLRLISMPSLEYARTFHQIQCTFGADKPLEGYSYLEPQSSRKIDRSVTIDDRPLTDYGIKPIKGTINGIACRPETKTLLLRNISSVPGASYDENTPINDPDDTLGNDYEVIGTSYKGINGKWKRKTERGVVTYRSNEITLKCYMHAPTGEFWRNYDAMLYDLTKVDNTIEDVTQRGSRVLFLSLFGSQFKCYYKSQRVTDAVCSDGSIWVKFDLVLSVFEDLGDFYWLIASEDGRYVLTEDGRKMQYEFDF